jgi:hypothetical protein
MRTLVRDPSRDQPAMRTILLGLAFVITWYVIAVVVLAHWIGGGAAMLVIVVVFLAANVDFMLRDRLRRAWTRGRTYLALRAHPALRTESLAEIDALTADGVALEAALLTPRTDGR